MISPTEANTSTRPRAFESPIVATVGGAPVARAKSGEQSLSEAERRKLEELKQTDARVKRHEEAHRAAAGSLYRGGPNYTYETGPDGKRYAVAGSVQIDTSPGRTPEETVQKASAIRRAALAPTDPSGTDRAVAAKASRMEAAARRALARESMQASAESPGPSTPAPQPEQESDRRAVAPGSPPDNAPEPPAPETDASNRVLSPGDLGAEVWSIVSDLSNSEQLRQERQPGELPPAGPSLDLLA